MRRLSVKIRNKLSASLSRLIAQNENDKDPELLTQINQTNQGIAQEKEQLTSNKETAPVLMLAKELADINTSIVFDTNTENYRAFISNFYKFGRLMSSYSAYLGVSKTKEELLNTIRGKVSEQEKEQKNVLDNFTSIFVRSPGLVKNDIENVVKTEFQSLEKLNIPKYPGFGDAAGVEGFLKGESIDGFEFKDNISLLNLYCLSNKKNLFNIILKSNKITDSATRKFLIENSKIVESSFTQPEKISEDFRNIVRGELKIDDICNLVWRELGQRYGTLSSYGTLVKTKHSQGTDVKITNGYYDSHNEEKFNEFAKKVQFSNVRSLTQSLRGLEKMKRNIAKDPGYYDRDPETRTAINALVADTELKQFEKYYNTALSGDLAKMRTIQGEISSKIEFYKNCITVRKSLESYNEISKSNVFLDNEAVKDFIRQLADTEVQKVKVLRQLNDDLFNDSELKFSEVKNQILKVLDNLTSENNIFDSNLSKLSKLRESISTSNNLTDVKEILQSSVGEQDTFTLLNSTVGSTDEGIQIIPKDSKIQKSIEKLSEQALKSVKEQSSNEFAAEQEELLSENSEATKVRRQMRNTALQKRTLMSLPSLQNRRTRVHSNIVDSIGSFGGSLKARLGEYGVGRLTSELNEMKKYLDIAGFEKLAASQKELTTVTNQYVSAVEAYVPEIKAEIEGKLKSAETRHQEIETRTFQEAFSRLLTQLEKKTSTNLKSELAKNYRSIQGLNSILSASNSFGGLLEYDEVTGNAKLNVKTIEELGQKPETWKSFVIELNDFTQKVHDIKRNHSISHSEETNLEKGINEAENKLSELKSLYKKLLSKSTAKTTQKPEPIKDLELKSSEIKSETDSVEDSDLETKSVENPKPKAEIPQAILSQSALWEEEDDD